MVNAAARRAGRLRCRLVEKSRRLKVGGERRQCLLASGVRGRHRAGGLQEVSPRLVAGVRSGWLVFPQSRW